MWFGKKSVPDWHETFVAIARRAFDAQDLTFEQALAALRNASGPELLSFDESARSSRFYAYPADRDVKAVLRNALNDAENADTYLFYKACNASGYIREQALRALRRHDNRLACAAILIRSEDWVPQVADVALLLLEDIAASDTVRHCFELLELVVSMRSRQRFEPHWAGILQPALLLPKWQELRLAQLRNDNGVVRLLAHELIWRANDHAAFDTLRLAISDAHRPVALWALVKTGDYPDEAQRQALLREGMRARLASVRSDALRRYCRGGYGDLREVLEAAIFDSAHSVRGVAAFQLNEIFDVSALTHWRAAFDRGNQGEAMVMAISEYGGSEDVLRLRRHVASDRGRVRALALRGLLRLGVPDSAELLGAALHDSSPRVVDVAIGGYARGTDPLTMTALNDAFAAARTPGMRARLIGASRLLGKWERLQFLLARLAKAHESEREPLNVALWRWVATANRSFVPAHPEQQLDLRRAIETARIGHPARFWDQLLRLV